MLKNFSMATKLGKKSELPIFKQILDHEWSKDIFLHKVLVVKFSLDPSNLRSLFF